MANGGFVVFTLLSSAHAAGGNEVFVSYSTPGTDRYADGSRVADGECYALVCTKKGAAFAGFTAMGTVVSPETDDIAVIAPAALDGRCSPVVFTLPKAYADAHRTDDWSVQLLDTRAADGRPVGLVNGVPGRINGFGRVDGTVSLAGVGMVAFGQASGPARASLASALPPELVPQPVITGIDVQDGRVVVSVDDTVPFVTYDLSGAGRTVTLEAEVGAGTRFFKVVRAE